MHVGMLDYYKQSVADNRMISSVMCGLIALSYISVIQFSQLKVVLLEI
jgi:hypothetical protein